MLNRHAHRQEWILRVLPLVALLAAGCHQGRAMSPTARAAPEERHASIEERHALIAEESGEREARLLDRRLTEAVRATGAQVTHEETPGGVALVLTAGEDRLVDELRRRTRKLADLQHRPSTPPSRRCTLIWCCLNTRMEVEDIPSGVRLRFTADKASMRQFVKEYAARLTR